MAPKIDVFVTSYLSSPAIRSRHDRVKRHLSAARVEYTTHDVAASEEAKSFWLRKERSKNRELPCILVEGEWVGTVEQLDEAVEFGELRQFLRLDSSAAKPPTDSTKSPTIDDFAALDLSEAELADLQKELEEAHPTSGFKGAQDGASQTFTPTAPLAFKPRTKEEKVTVVRALGDRAPLAQDHLDDLEGIELTEAEAEELARELGLTSADDILGPPTSTTKAAAPASNIPVPDNTHPSTSGKSPTQSDDKTASDPKHATLPDPSVSTATTSVSGKGGAELSASIAEVDKLVLSPEEKAELQSVQEETGGTLVVDPITDLEKKLIAETKRDVAREEQKKKEAEVKPELRTTVEQLDDIKLHLNREEYDYSTQVPVVGTGIEGNVAQAVKDGII